MGELCQRELKPWERVDVQLIVSAGMNIASGRVDLLKESSYNSS